jgi:hypothetical protein
MLRSGAAQVVGYRGAEGLQLAVDVLEGAGPFGDPPFQFFVELAQFGLGLLALGVLVVCVEGEGQVLAQVVEEGNDLGGEEMGFRCVQVDEGDVVLVADLEGRRRAIAAAQGETAPGGHVGSVAMSSHSTWRPSRVARRVGPDRRRGLRKWPAWLRY